jgi:hypothetical protein
MTAQHVVSADGCRLRSIAETEFGVQMAKLGLFGVLTGEEVSPQFAFVMPVDCNDKSSLDVRSGRSLVPANEQLRRSVRAATSESKPHAHRVRQP